MPFDKLAGYAGQILRIDLTNGSIKKESLLESVLKKYMGGATLGIKYIFDEVPDGTEWNAPQNRLFIGSGPLGGTRIGGSGSIAVVTKGALTNGIASSQANGFFSAFLRFAGYDAIILQGVAPEWSYIYIHDDGVEIRGATHLLGKTTLETESILIQDLGKRGEKSVF